MASLDAQTGSSPDPSLSEALTWALCVATFNRVDALKVCVTRAVEQSRPPKEVIVVDASTDWDDNRGAIEAILATRNIPLTYLQAKKRSLCVQRNQGIAAASADILFMIDDDSFMHPGCAAAIMNVYQKDRHEQVACVAAISAPPLSADTDASAIRQAGKSRSGLRRRIIRAMPGGLKRFVSRRVLLHSLEGRFVPYDSLGYRPLPRLPDTLSDEDAFPVRLVSGFRITVRRRIAQIEQFDEGLLSYCPAEDLDCTYRFLRHGQNVGAKGAFLYHHSASSGRLARREIAELSSLNIAYFLRMKSATPTAHFLAYYLWVLRKFMALALDDLGKGLWSFPGASGTAVAIVKSFSVFRHPRDQILPWYENVRHGILSKSRKRKGAK